jgi:protein-S-isoprenylcysteine O-methyltransferase Ste14
LPWTTERIIGLGISLPSLLLVLTARVQLGRAFSVRAKATHLVTSGLYSRVRNPIYVFSCLFILGIIIWPDEPWFLLIFAVIMPMQIYRARKESEVLQAKFGAEYLDYKRKTWF